VPDYFQLLLGVCGQILVQSPKKELQGLQGHGARSASFFMDHITILASGIAGLGWLKDYRGHNGPSSLLGVDSYSKASENLSLTPKFQIRLAGFLGPVLTGDFDHFPEKS
jgi:hypothetical protein